MAKDSRLIIMRHAKSDWHAEAARDFERPLASRGERDAIRMGQWLLKQSFIPEYLISSPAMRARQTSTLLAQELKIPPGQIIWVEQIYAASLQALLAAVETYAADTSCLQLVGHNPGLDELLCHLAAEAPRPTGNGKLMTTAAVAVLNFGSQTITTKANSASLEVLVRPKELAA